MKRKMKMKMVLTSVVMIFGLQGCFMKTVDSGEAGVEIKAGQVQKEVMSPGFHFSMNPLADLEVMNTKNKALIMNAKTVNLQDTSEIIYDNPVNFITAKNMEVPIDMAINYKLLSSCAPTMRTMYGSDGVWDTKAVISKVRDISRGVMGSATFEQLNSQRDMYSSKIKQNLNKEFTEMFGTGCVTVTMTSIQAIHLPPSLKKSIMEKQQSEQDVAKATLEAEKAVAKADGIAKSKRVTAQGIADARIIEANAIAKANDKISQSLTPEVLAYKQLENDKAQIDKWNGVRSKVVMGGNSQPLVQIPSVDTK